MCVLQTGNSSHSVTEVLAEISFDQVKIRAAKGKKPGLCLSLNLTPHKPQTEFLIVISRLLLISLRLQSCFSTQRLRVSAATNKSYSKFVFFLIT